MKPLSHVIFFCSLSLVLSAETFADNIEKSAASAESKSSVSNPSVQKTGITNESEYAEVVKKREGVTPPGSAKSSQSKSTLSKSASSESVKPSAE